MELLELECRILENLRRRGQNEKINATVTDATEKSNVNVTDATEKSNVTVTDGTEKSNDNVTEASTNKVFVATETVR